MHGLRSCSPGQKPSERRTIRRGKRCNNRASQTVPTCGQVGYRWLRFSQRKIVPSKVISIRQSRASPDTEAQRQHELFDWCDGVLNGLGLTRLTARSQSVEELRKLLFNGNAADMALKIRTALHPASSSKAACFVGLREGALKRILKSRFNELKKEREAELRRRDRGQSGEELLAPDWTDKLKLDDGGRARPILSNLTLYLRLHPEWAGVLAYDEFDVRVVTRRAPPWGEVQPNTRWNDQHETQTRLWFQNEDINPGLGDVGRAVQAAARHNPVHPVREYLDGLIWDGKRRLDTWLVAYLHAEESEYIRAIGPRFLISAVARIYEPGCQVDHMLVLEGPQGRRKSQSLQALAVRPEWFSDRLSHMASKDAAIEVAGVWLFELAEMDALTRASSSTAKAFLTRRHDRFRPPYGKHTVSSPRQCVFAGTINPPVGGYLKDLTGGRRFWPVACAGMIDADGIERDRDQLWAEAVHRYHGGDKWWLETPALEALATTEQTARLVSDSWTQPITQWLGADKNDVTIAAVLQGALGIQPADQSHSDEIRVAKVLMDLGYERYLGRTGSSRQKRYRRARR